MYVEDHNDWLVPNNPPNYGGGTLATWAWGDIRYGNPDGTNIDYIIGQREGSLGPYVKTYRIFKCPTDRSQTKLTDGNSYPRVRSYSMNMFMGTTIRDGSGPDDNVWTIFMKQSDLNIGPRPELFVFMDVHEVFLDKCGFDLSNDVGLYHEVWHNLPASRHGGSGVDVHEDSLTTCLFVLDRDKNWELWAHLPASRHSDRGVISYTDGHAEIHRWRDARTLVPVKGVFQGGVIATGSQDWKYVWERLTKGTADFGDP
jgi:prepilin-type processing-associated H-X9-DG protein